MDLEIRQQALEKTRKLVIQAAKEIVLTNFMKSSKTEKDDGSWFTESDINMQNHLLLYLPEIAAGAVLGEEMSASEQQKLWQDNSAGLWCIDPIDGTTNFVAGIPMFAVSVAYLINGEPQWGVVYNPATDECFSACLGGGATLNKRSLPLRTPATELKKAIAGVDFKRINRALATALANNPPYYSQRNFGSSALEWCYLAAARLDVYLHGGQMLWDYAAGRLILAEAGGAAASLDGDSLAAGPSIKRGIVASANTALFESWQNWLSNHQ